VEFPTRHLLIFNLKTAKTLDLTIHNNRSPAPTAERIAALHESGCALAITCWACDETQDIRNANTTK
jgi:hypothetical protein